MPREVKWKHFFVINRYRIPWGPSFHTGNADVHKLKMAVIYTGILCWLSSASNMYARSFHLCIYHWSQSHRLWVSTFSWGSMPKPPRCCMLRFVHVSVACMCTCRTLSNSSSSCVPKGEAEEKTPANHNLHPVGTNIVHYSCKFRRVRTDRLYALHWACMNIVLLIPFIESFSVLQSIRFNFSVTRLRGWNQ